MEGRNDSYAIGILIPALRPTPSAPPLTNAFSIDEHPTRASAPTLANAFSVDDHPAAVTRPATDEAQRVKKKYYCCLVATIVAVLMALVVILVVVGIGIFIYPKFGLNSLSVLKFNISGDEITAEWDVGFLARNPNPLWSFTFVHPTISVFYNNQLLAEDVFPDIHLPKKKPFEKEKIEYYTGNAVSLAARIDDRRVADAIARDWSQGVVAFTIGLLGSFEQGFDFTCANIMVGFRNDSRSLQGTMLQQHSPNNITDLTVQPFSRCSSSY